MSRRHAPRATTPSPKASTPALRTTCTRHPHLRHLRRTSARQPPHHRRTVARTRERPPMARNPNAGPTPPQPGDIDPDEGAGNVTGLTVNEQAIHAMRKAASIVRYCTLTLRDEADRAGTPHSPPRTDGSPTTHPNSPAGSPSPTPTPSPPRHQRTSSTPSPATSSPPKQPPTAPSTLAASTGHPSTSPATTTTPATR